MPRVLTIDDHHDSCDALARLLRLEGFDTQTAATGFSGIALALAHTADVILVDLHLPDISGLDVVRALRAHGILTPIIIITAFPDLDPGFDLRSVGASGYAEGLLSFDELVDIIRRALCDSTPSPHPLVNRSASAPATSATDEPQLRPIDTRVRSIVRAIDGEGDTPVSISRLAARIRVSDSRLRHLFRDTLGMPVLKFLRMRRVHRLAQRLIVSSESIESLAAREHLPSDLRRMRNIFRQRFGMSPAEYRRRFRRRANENSVS